MGILMGPFGVLKGPLGVMRDHFPHPGFNQIYLSSQFLALNGNEKSKDYVGKFKIY